jgi:hypothetical protein
MGIVGMMSARPFVKLTGTPDSRVRIECAHVYKIEREERERERERESEEGAINADSGIASFVDIMRIHAC